MSKTYVMKCVKNGETFFSSGSLDKGEEVSAGEYDEP